MNKKILAIVLTAYLLLISGCNGPEVVGSESGQSILKQFEENKERYSIVQQLSDDPNRSISRYFRSIDGIKVINDYFDVSSAEDGSILEIKKTAGKAEITESADFLVDSFHDYQDEIQQVILHSGESAQSMKEVSRDKVFFLKENRIIPVLIVDVIFQLEDFPDRKIYCFDMFDGSQIEYEELLDETEYLPSEYPNA